MRTKEEVAEKLKELLKEHRRVKDAGGQQEAALLEGGIFLLSWVLEVEKGAIQEGGVLGIEDEDSKEKLAEFLIADDDEPKREFSRVVFKESTDSIKVYPDRIVVKVGVGSSQKGGGEEK
jgi:hypothetical protein